MNLNLLSIKKFFSSIFIKTKKLRSVCHKLKRKNQNQSKFLLKNILPKC